MTFTYPIFISLTDQIVPFVTLVWQGFVTHPFFRRYDTDEQERLADHLRHVARHLDGGGKDRLGGSLVAAQALNRRLGPYPSSKTMNGKAAFRARNRVVELSMRTESMPSQ